MQYHTWHSSPVFSESKQERKVFFCGTGVWIQGVTLPRQVLYWWTHFQPRKEFLTRSKRWGQTPQESKLVGHTQRFLDKKEEDTTKLVQSWAGTGVCLISVSISATFLALIPHSVAKGSLQPVPDTLWGGPVREVSRPQKCQSRMLYFLTIHQLGPGVSLAWYYPERLYEENRLLISWATVNNCSSMWEYKI
jgi:hypothetical protein